MSENKALTPVAKLKSVMAVPSVQEQFANAMKDKKDLFIASLIDLYGSDTYLQKCEPRQVVMEALKAATLNLPINKSLGFAFIVPYKNKGKEVPQFQLGYKGMIQLAMRTGQYRHINADVVYDGEFKGYNRITGALDITGEKKSDDIVGYFAHIETINGFSKTMYMSRADMENHAKKYSKSYNREFSPWKTEFDAMAKKTMIRQLLGKYGIMTVEMADGMAKDSHDSDADYRHNANRETIDITPQPEAATAPEGVDSETGEITCGENGGEDQAPAEEEMPPFMK